MVLLLSVMAVVIPVGSPTHATSARATMVSTQGVYIRAMDASMVNLINSYRAAHGRSRLNLDGGLTSQARRWSIHLAGIRALRHDPHMIASARRGGCSASRLGEIIASRAGSRVSSRNIFAMYIASRPHREMILSHSFRFFGISTVDRSASRGRSYWDVVKFAYSC